MKSIYPDNENLTYCGRIDFQNPKAPVFVFAGSFVRFRFTGKNLAVKVSNQQGYYHNSLGYFLDGTQGKFDLADTAETNEYVIAGNLEDTEHEFMLFKRQDGCHYFTLYEFLTDDSAQIEPLPLPDRRIEVFGDSISCGEVSEIVELTGKPDPENHQGIYSNSWYSYSWITARNLNAQVHISSQGGAALKDGTGWFHGPDYVGLETIVDKIQYNSQIAPVTSWDLQSWKPQVVVFAFGQNDNNPEDFMANAYGGAKAQAWISDYILFLKKLMNVYENAHFVLTTTTLNHHENWDKAIDQVVTKMALKRVTRLYYTNNGCGTPGHLRIPEQEQMATELTAHINSLGDIWND